MLKRPWLIASILSVLYLALLVHQVSTATAVPSLVAPDHGPDMPPLPDGLPSDASADPIGAALDLLTHVARGEGILAAAALLALIAAVALRAARRVPWGSSKRGRAALAGVVGLASSMAALLASGHLPGPGAVWGALAVTWAAVGARSWLRNLLWPADGEPWLPWLRDLLDRLDPMDEAALERGRQLYQAHARVLAVVPHSWGDLTPRERRRWATAAIGLGQ